MTSEQAAVFVAQGPTMVSEQPEPLVLRLPGAPERMWRIAAVHGDCPSGFIRMSDGQTRLLSGEMTFSAAALASAGLPLPMQRPETALLLELMPAG